MSDMGWNKFPENAPPVGAPLLLIVSGKCEQVLLLHMPTIGEFDGKEWMLDEYPEWEDPIIEFWMPFPEYPEPIWTEIHGLLDGSLLFKDVFDRVMKEAREL